MTASWVPYPGELVEDTGRGRVGKAVGWDGPTGVVTLAPLGGGAFWETAVYRPYVAPVPPSARTVRGARGQGWP